MFCCCFRKQSCPPGPRCHPKSRSSRIHGRRPHPYSRPRPPPRQPHSRKMPRLDATANQRPTAPAAAIDVGWGGHVRGVSTFTATARTTATATTTSRTTTTGFLGKMGRERTGNITRVRPGDKRNTTIKTNLASTPTAPASSSRRGSIHRDLV